MPVLHSSEQSLSAKPPVFNDELIHFWPLRASKEGENITFEILSPYRIRISASYCLSTYPNWHTLIKCGTDNQNNELNLAERCYRTDGNYGLW